MGVSEMSNFSEGNNKIIDAIISSNSESIVGGGDTISSITNYNKSLLSEFSHISTGGGAALHLLCGTKLPAIDILDKK
jgi:phosphoglycerate kinase